MCSRACLCNSCYKKKTCSDCLYISLHRDVDCFDGGVDECEFYKDAEQG